MATSGDGEVAESSSSVCGICVGTVRDARLLPCLHSFCKSCLDDLNMRTGHDHNITCPICHSTCRVPENGASGFLKDITRTEEEVCECDTCKEDGGEGLPEVSCTTCRFGLCKEHCIPHLLANPDHIIKPLAEKGSVKPLAAGSSAVRNCEEHHLPLRWYCKQCNTAVCGECTALGAHNGHTPIVRVADIGKELHQRVQRKTDHVKNERLPRVHKALSAVENMSAQLSSRADNVRTQIRSTGKRLTDAVQLLIQRKLVEVDNLEKARLKDLNGQHQDLKRHADKLKSVVSFGEKILKSDSTEDVYDLLFAIEKRADELQNVGIAKESLQHARVDLEGMHGESVLAKACELVDSVIPHQTSTAHSLVEGQGKKACFVGETLSFTIAAKDNNGQALVKGGDEIREESLELPSGGQEQPSIEVLDKNNGTYEIPCTPRSAGDSLFEASINNVKLQQHLSFSCHNSYSHLTFDPTECQHGSTISADQLTVTHTGMNKWSSVLGSWGMKTGQYSWKVKVTRSAKMGIFLGVAEKTELTAKENNYLSTYSWYGGNVYKYIVGKTGRSMSKWQVNDVLQLDFDCDTHTLFITNIRTHERDSITNLPARELFAYFSSWNKDDSLTLVQ